MYMPKDRVLKLLEIVYIKIKLTKYIYSQFENILMGELHINAGMATFVGKHYAAY